VLTQSLWSYEAVLIRCHLDTLAWLDMLSLSWLLRLELYRLKFDYAVALLYLNDI